MNQSRIVKLGRQQGAALVTVLLLITVLTILLGASAMLTRNSLKEGARQFAREGQASNVARAGLQVTLSWFKSQIAQPVRQDTDIVAQQCSIHKAFFPRVNTTNIELGDTLDENIGLVKEFKIQEPNIYGYYMVRRYDCTKSDTDPWNLKAVRDITFRRGKQDGNSTEGQGVVWSVQSEGVIYQKKDPNKTPFENPNRILQRATAAVEINRISLSVPKSPLNLTGTGTSSFNNRCEVTGDPETTHGIVRNSTTPGISGTPLFTLPGTATQQYQINTGSGEQNKNVVNTFNMTLQELKAVSDKVYGSVTEISAVEPIPFGVTFLEGNGSSTFVFNSSKPLKGSGILFVNGNLTLENDSNSAFSGLVYITGNLNMGASNSLGGSIVANNVTCTPSTNTTLEYNDNVMTNVRQRLGLYRQNNLTLNISN